MSRSIDQEIKLVRNSDAERLHFPVPPGVVGYDPQYRSSTPYSVKQPICCWIDITTKDASGWRTQPNGKPLVVEYKARNDSIGQQSAELWKKNFDSLHIRMVYKPMLFSDLLRSQNNVRECLVLLHGSLIIQMGIILCRILWPKYSYD